MLQSCKEQSGTNFGHSWTLGDAGTAFIEEFWNVSEAYGSDDDVYTVSGETVCKDFEHDIWFGLVKTMSKKHHSVFDDHIKYVTNKITKPFKVRTLKNTEFVNEIFELDYYISPIIKKGQQYH